MVNKGDWDHSKALAKVILVDRGRRRNWLGRLLLLSILWMAVGLWGLDNWLADSPVRFLIWWGICGLLASVLIVFALFDALAVLREERRKLK